MRLSLTTGYFHQSMHEESDIFVLHINFGDGALFSRFIPHKEGKNANNREHTRASLANLCFRVNCFYSREKHE